MEKHSDEEFYVFDWEQLSPACEFPVYSRARASGQDICGEAAGYKLMFWYEDTEEPSAIMFVCTKHFEEVLRCERQVEETRAQAPVEEASD